MNIVLSFVGTLPDYILDCIYQLRLFYDGNIYLISNDTNTLLCNALVTEYNIIIINYDIVSSNKFIETYNKNINKFVYLPNLNGRSLLMSRSLERFFLLRNAMEKYLLTDVFFIELDNLIYDDPHCWLPQFSKYQLCYMYDNERRFSSGIMYVKSLFAINIFTEFIISYIEKFVFQDEWLGDMIVLYEFYMRMKDIDNFIHILPTIWKDVNTVNKYEIACSNFNQYKSVFDSSGMGIYLFGIDRIPIIVGLKNPFSKIDYTIYQYKWIEDYKMRKIPHVYNGVEWIRINNLHIHSKQLFKALSI